MSDTRMTTAELTFAEEPPQPSGRPPLKVALVRGPIVFAKGAFNNEATPAIGFAYIAAYIMRHGYSVTIVDAIGEALNHVYPLEKYPGFLAQGLTVEDMIARIPADVEIIGFSGMFSGEWPVVRDLIQVIGETFPRAFLVAGGEHATAVPEFILRDCPVLDAVVKGEGEHTFFELIESVREGSEIASVSGVCYVDKEGAFHNNGALPRIRTIDDIPRPYWPEGYLEKFWAAGKSHGVLTERDMPMVASRGCPYQCTFCSSPQMWTTRYELRQATEVVEEIKAYIRKYDITSVQFYDLTAIVKRDWIITFCRALLDQGVKIHWSLPAGTRSEVLDEETLALVKESGCHYLVYAPESGSRATLKLIKKKIKLDRITKSMVTAKRLGLVLRANLIIGFPFEPRKDIYKTLLYGLSLSWKGVDEVAVFLFSAYPGSELFDSLVKQDKIQINDPYFFDLTSLNGKYNTLRPQTYNEFCGSIELGLYRFTFLTLNYVVGYLRHPFRVVRTIRNLLSGKGAATVLEHRLRDALRRWRVREN